MATINIYRGRRLSEAITVTGVDDGTIYNVVTSWRAGTSVTDWSISQTVTKASGEVPYILTPYQTAQLPFGTIGATKTYGVVKFYKIDTDGYQVPAASYTLNVIDVPGGADYTYSDMNLWFDYEGQAAVAFLDGTHYIGATAVTVKVTQTGTAPDEGTAPWCVLFYDESLSAITKMTIGCQTAPLTTDLIMEIYTGGVASSATVTLPAGDTTATGVVNVSI